MKCVCGYEYEYEYKENHSGIVVIKGDNPFFQLTLSNNIKVVYQSGYRDYYSDGFSETTLYACPKCGTVKIDI